MRIETKTVHEVDAFEFERFVRATYGIEFSFQADQECGNDTQHTFNVAGEVDEWEQDEIDQLLNGGYPTYVTGALLNYMARSSLIPLGVYLIRLAY